MKKLSILAAGLFAAAPAFGAVQGDVGAYLWKGGPTKGNGGIGINGYAQIADPFFVHGMFETGERGDEDSTEIRAGGGVSRLLSKTVVIWTGAELVDVDIEGAGGIDDSGFALFGGTAVSPATDLWLTAEFGIADVGDAEGSEWAAGMSYTIARPFSVTLKRRESIGFTDTHIGVSYSFGGM